MTITDPATERELRLTIVVPGDPAPQGSKAYKGHRRNAKSGRISAVLVEQVKGVKPWRQRVHAAALAAIRDYPDWQPLDGPLAADMVFTVRTKPDSRPVWWPRNVRWSKHFHWRPASAPDLSKLARSTEDALTTARAWKDDARLVEYGRLAKYYAGDPSHPDALPLHPSRSHPMTTATGRPTTGATDTENWRAYAACAEVDADLHFPTPHTNGWKKQTKRAKAICGGCPVRETCLTWALDTRQPAGIWGGMSERERRRLLGIQQSQTQLCLDRQPWIEQQVAANVSQREIARRLGVERATLSRAVARFEAERAAAGAVKAA